MLGRRRRRRANIIAILVQRLVSTWYGAGPILETRSCTPMPTAKPNELPREADEGIRYDIIKVWDQMVICIWGGHRCCPDLEIIYCVRSAARNQSIKCGEPQIVIVY